MCSHEVSSIHTVLLHPGTNADWCKLAMTSLDLHPRNPASDQPATMQPFSLVVLLFEEESFRAFAFGCLPGAAHCFVATADRSLLLTYVPL